MKAVIQLGHRKHAKKGETLVDACYHAHLNKYKWHFTVGRNYVGGRTDGGKMVFLHRYVLGLAGVEIPKGTHVDHIDRNSMNNTLANLRVVTPSINTANRRKNKNNTTGFRNVRFQKEATLRPYYGYINKDKKFHYLGSFRTAEEAARAVNEAFRKLYPEIPIPNPTVELK